MIADIPSDNPALAPWAITALPLPPALALDLLCACVGKTHLAQGMLVGPTLAFWARLLRFTGALVGREQLVPGLRQAGSGYRSAWQPVVAGPDNQRLARIVRAMPAACRALSTSAEEPPRRPGMELAHAFIARMTDLLVRTAINGPILPSAKSGGRVAVLKHTSIHDLWVHSLYSTDGQMNAPADEVASLAEQMRAWQRPIAVASETAFQLALRLEDPPPDAPERSAWKIQYLLQARDEPSLMIPVSEAWKERGRAAALFRQRGFEPREYTLTALGQAATLYSPIEASLKSPTPSGCRLDVGGANHFLTEGAYLLEQAGFTVLLPSWWAKKGRGARIGLQAAIHSGGDAFGGSTGGMSMSQIIDFNWQAAIAGEPISLEELRGLAHLKAPLVRVRGQWVQVRADEIRSIIEILEKKPTGQATLRDVVKMALGGGEAPGGLPFDGVKAEGWVGDFLAQLEGSAPLKELKAPQGFRGTLRPYQLRGYSWLTFLRQWGMGGCLADDMGLGKTIQTLAMLQREYGRCPRPTLLVCPTSVVSNWKKEAERFTPELPVMIHHGGSRIKGPAFTQRAEEHALVLTSYSLLYRDRELFEAVPWAGVILDEAQNIKNAQTKQAQAAFAIKGDYRLALTGTPVENHVGDLWSIMNFLNPGWLGTQAEFRRRFYVPIQAEQDAEAALRLKRLTGPFLLRRLKTDKGIIADLPDKLEMKVYCNLTREQGSLYAAIVKDMQEKLENSEGIERKGLILATLTKLKQVCNHPAQLLHDNSEVGTRSGKVSRLVEMLEEVFESEDRVLIFTQFTEMGEMLKTHLQETFGQEVLFLHGGTQRTARARMVERFQSAGGPRVFLLSLKAGGTGLNLTAASHVFHFDRWWNPAVEDQATDRAFRIGQVKNVQVHKFVCAGTVEEKIDDMITRKQSVASSVVSAGEAWLTEMNNAQLRDLFALRQDAVAE
jgi:superfamily II DNA or RNA helicase